MSEKQTILVADYKGLENAIQADLNLRLFGDEQMAIMYSTPKYDIHSRNAMEIFGVWLKWTVPTGMPYAGLTVDKIPMAEFKEHPFGKMLRDDFAKAIGFGIAYGKRGYGFSTLVGIDGKMIGEELANKMVNAYLDSLPGLRAWEKWVERFVRKHHGIYSLGGRWCDLSIEMESSDEWMHKRAFRRALNFPMQASGADIVGDAMVRVAANRELEALGFRTILQVHDELVLRGPESSVERAGELLRADMVSATANGTKLLLDLQVSVGHGDTYYDAK